MPRRAESSVVSVAREYEHSGIGACGDLPLHWSASSYPLGGTVESGLSGLEQCGLCRDQHATLITDLGTVDRGYAVAAEVALPLPPHGLPLPL
jgi:hypothetical protein